MTTRIATFIALIAFVFFGTIARANVLDPSHVQRELSDQMILHSIDHAPGFGGCEVASRSVRTEPFAVPPYKRSVPDGFAGSFNAAGERRANDTCDFPVPRPDPFQNVARK